MRLPCTTPIKSYHFERCERLLRSVNVLTSNEVNAHFERSKTTLLKSFIEIKKCIIVILAIRAYSGLAPVR